MNDENEWRGWTPEPKVTPETPETPERPEEEVPQDPEQGRSAEKDEETPETPEVPDLELSTQEALERLLKRYERTFLPPDIVRQDRPSLLRVISYAWAGDWGPKEGVIRALGKADAILLGIPGVAIFYALAWWWERPTRRWGLIVLLALAGYYLKIF